MPLNNKEKRAAQGRAYYKKTKDIIIENLGGKCSCCGEPTREFLTIEHIGGGGNKHRKAKGIYGTIKDIKSSGYDRGKYSVLCYNCNMSLGAFGYCPHNKIIDSRNPKLRNIKLNQGFTIIMGGV